MSARLLNIKGSPRDRSDLPRERSDIPGIFGFYSPPGVVPQRVWSSNGFSPPTGLYPQRVWSIALLYRASPGNPASIYIYIYKSISIKKDVCMYVNLIVAMHSQAVGDNDPKPSRVAGYLSADCCRGVGKVDGAKSVSPVCIPSVGLRPIDAKSKGGDSGGAPDSKTATKLGHLRPGVLGQVGGPGGPVLCGFKPN
jgi:hypothetical protein